MYICKCIIIKASHSFAFLSSAIGVSSKPSSPPTPPTVAPISSPISNSSSSSFTTTSPPPTTEAESKFTSTLFH